MTPIKSYTDVNQSKMLAEILPLENADMCWFEGEPFVEAVTGYEEERAEAHRQAGMEMYPCWSLAALFGVLPNKIVSHETAFEGKDAEGISDIYYKRIESTEDGRYMCRYSGNGYKYKCVADNPIDACYEMILKLKELNLL